MLRRKSLWAVITAVRVRVWDLASIPVRVLARIVVKDVGIPAQEVARIPVLALADGRLSKTM
jgi:hypothetical protein